MNSEFEIYSNPDNFPTDEVSVFANDGVCPSNLFSPNFLIPSPSLFSPSFLIPSPDPFTFLSSPFSPSEAEMDKVLDGWEYSASPGLSPLPTSPFSEVEEVAENKEEQVEVEAQVQPEPEVKIPVAVEYSESEMVAVHRFVGNKFVVGNYGALFNEEENTFIFSNMDQLSTIIDATGGAVEVFILPNSGVSPIVQWLNRYGVFKKLSLYVPAGEPQLVE